MKTSFFTRVRPLSDVPLWLKLSLPAMLLLQLLWHGYSPVLQAEAKPLPPPLSAETYRLISLDEPLTVARYLNLWLQSFDNQAGISLSFHQLDYDRVIQWLDTILALDTKGQYPLLVASHIYGSIHSPRKQRQMMDYIYAKFQQRPGQYWRWLAHAVIVAKHELKDMELALRYADALAAESNNKEVPYWAKDLKIIVLEDMGELEAARVLAGGLIENGDIDDPYEIRFLLQKIEVLEQKMMNNRQDVEMSTESVK